LSKQDAQRSASSPDAAERASEQARQPHAEGLRRAQRDFATRLALISGFPMLPRMRFVNQTH
jgi:hypothetical protein